VVGLSSSSHSYPRMAPVGKRYPTAWRKLSNASMHSGSVDSSLMVMLTHGEDIPSSGVMVNVCGVVFIFV